MKLKLLLFLLFIVFYQSQNLYSQSDKNIKGRILSKGGDLYGVNVVNSYFHSITDVNGNFEISAKIGDTLKITAIQYFPVSKVISKEDYEKNELIIRLELLVRNIDEVVIDQYKNINLVSLGLVSKNQKKYTPAERKLKTAGDFKPIHLLSILGGTLPFDPILNAINGRTKSLKKAIVVEKKEFLLEYISNNFDEEFFRIKLKIPIDYVQGFKYYIIENDKIVNAINAKNKTLATFLISELSVKYLELLNKKE
jgi:hypothetical protein